MTRNLLRSIFSLTAIFWSASSVSQVQRPGVPLQRLEAPSGFYDALNLVADDTTKARLDLNYRILHDFFIFVRSTLAPSDFVARGEITIEILDDRNISIAREIIRKELHRKEIAPGESGPQAAIHGNVSFALKPGTYRVHFEVEDLESNRKMKFPGPPVLLKKFHDGSPGLTDPLAVEQIDTSGGKTIAIHPFNFGGDIPFGKNFSFILQASGWQDSSRTLHYTLSKLDETKKKQLVLSDSATPVPSLANTRLRGLQQDTMLSYTLENRPSPPAIETYLISLRGDTLQPGQYEIELSASGARSNRKSFAIRWFDKPRSLMNETLATEALEYLMSETEYEDFITKKPEERKKAFEEFWSRRDPTPNTAYNEAMAEYYRRCDYALENFSGIGIPNGLKTDRGKIYVLYGPPTKTERTLSVGAPPREVWEYENIGRRFVFVDETRTGKYKLLFSEKL